MHTEYWAGSKLREGRHFEESVLDWNIILNGSSGNQIELKWLRIETSGCLLRTRR
jgi:hypothetical protein